MESKGPLLSKTIRLCVICFWQHLFLWASWKLCIFMNEGSFLFFNHKDKKGKHVFEKLAWQYLPGWGGCNSQGVLNVPRESWVLFYSWYASSVKQLLTNASAAKRQWHELADCISRDICIWEDRASKILRERCSWSSPVSGTSVSALCIPREDWQVSCYLKILVQKQKMKPCNFHCSQDCVKLGCHNVWSWCVRTHKTVCLHLRLPNSFQFHLWALLEFETLYG